MSTNTPPPPNEGERYPQDSELPPDDTTPVDPDELGDEDEEPERG